MTHGRPHVKKVRRKIRTPGAGKKVARMRGPRGPPVGAKRQPDAIIIPGVTGPIIPEAEAAAFGFTKYIPAVQSMYKSKKMFSTGGKPLTKGQQAAYDKKQRYLKRAKGEWEFQTRTQTGVEKKFGDVPTNIFYSPVLKKKVALTGKEAPKRTKDYPGAQRDWLDTQMIQISGPAEAAAGGMKDKGLKIIKGQDKPIALALWNWQQDIPKTAGKGYFKLTEKVGGMGRFQQSYVSARFKPKKGVAYSVERLPPGRGIQTEYVAWFDQPGVSATVQTGAVTGQTQVRKVVKKGAGTGKASFKTIGAGSIRQQLDYKGKATGKTEAVVKRGGKSATVDWLSKKQYKTGRYSLSTKKPFTRQVRSDMLAGKITGGDKIVAEQQLDKIYADAVRSGQPFTKTLNLGVWRKLNIKQKVQVVEAAFKGQISGRDFAST